MSILDTRHSRWTDRFSEYLSGGLSEQGFREVEDHLDSCGACRTTLAELRAVISRAGELEDLQPPRDLWDGIAATIQAPAPVTDPVDAKVIALPTATSATGDRARLTEAGDGRLLPRTRLVFTAPQLIAASIALIAASALTTWAAGPGLGVRGQALGPTVPAGAVTMASDLAAPPEGLADELSTLEAALAEARAELDPNTVRVLERNLGVIEQAIEDSHRALAQDPGNDFLTNHLERVYQRKLTYLRDATQVAGWAG